MRKKYGINPFVLLVASLLLVSFFSGKLNAQEPTTQDCRGAIAVCDFLYEEENTASGYGNYFEIPEVSNNTYNN